MLDHLRMAGRPRWLGFTAFALVMLAVFLLLGRWQLERAASQSVIDERVGKAASAPLVDGAEVLSAAPLTPDLEWRRVRVSGVYDADGQFLVRNRTLNGANGYLVLVPLQTDLGRDLLVIRGWIPSGPTAAAPVSVPLVPAGQVTVEGPLRLPEPSSGASGLPIGQIDRIVPTELSELTGRPTYPAWVTASSENPPATGAASVEPLPDRTSPGWTWPVSHTLYAFQWFTFAVIAVVGWFILLRRDVRSEAQAETTSDPVS